MTFSPLRQCTLRMAKPPFAQPTAPQPHRSVRIPTIFPIHRINGAKFKRDVITRQPVEDSEDAELPQLLKLKYYSNFITYVQSPAKIIEPPAHVKVVSGETALFFCRATGNPTPTVNFLIDRKISHPRLGVGVVLTIPDGSLLRLSKTDREQNGLQVECVARNHVGGDSATARLTVYDANAELPAGYPTILVPPKSTSAAVGDIARLECEVSGHPSPRVIWIKNEIPIPTNGPRISIVSSGSLLFEHLLLSDEGHYECLVTNNVGSVLSSKAYLGVRNTYFVPKIVDKVDQIRVRPGHGANLTCRAAGNPIPSARWLTDRERPITESTEGVATLFLADITEPARYICEANNSLGTVQHPVRVHVIDVPPAPVNLKSLEEGSNYVFLQWYPPRISPDGKFKAVDGQSIDSYTLFLYEGNRSKASTTKKQLTDIPAKQYHPDGALQYKVVNLKPHTSYSAEVAAVSNVVGMSDPSNAVHFTTAEAAPTSAPQTVQAYAVSDDTVLVTWKPPSEPNGRIIKYLVVYTRDDKLPLNKWHQTESAGESIQIRGLQPSETYFVKIAAFNSVSGGPYTEAFPVIVKYGIPSQPMNFRGVTLSPRQVELRWTEPKVPQNVRLQDYMLRYRSSEENGAGGQPKEVTIGPGKTSARLDDLTPNTTYHISLAARTAYGTGVGAQIIVRTESNVPGMPSLHEMDILDSSRIRVRWISPENRADFQNATSSQMRTRGPKILHYLVQWAPFPFTDWEQKKIEVEPKSSPYHIYEHIIYGLLSRTAYKLRIIPVGAEGMGTALAVGPVRTRGQVPSAPRNLRLNQLRRALPPGVNDPGSEFAILELAWDPPERSHGDLRGYQVSHRLLGPLDVLYSQKEDEFLPKDPLPSKPIRKNVTQTAYTSTIADGIKFGRIYQFEVAAYNGVDLGLPAQLNVSTPEEVPESSPIHVRLNGLSATSIEATWSPPMQQQWGGDILNYQVRYFQPSAPNTTEVITNAAEPRLRIENLKERTFYTVMVRAITSSGPGPWSMANTIRTTAELPEPPSQITGVRINPRQIKMTWSTATSDQKPKQRIPITGFRIFYSKADNQQDSSTWQILDVGPVTMATLDALDPKSNYMIKIKSRGADRRFGRLSEPVIVGTNDLDDLNRIGSNYPGGSTFEKDGKRVINQLSCHWVPALETARPGEASLKLNWQRPADADGLHQFQIQLLGSKSYIDENNQPHRVHFEPRTLDVALSTLESSSAPSPSEFTLPYLSSASVAEQPNYSLVIDELEANTVYDIQIRPVYTDQSEVFSPDGNAPTGKTSCRTLMLPPLHVPRPVPVAVKQQTGQVVMRVFRASESLGRIRRYYLILSKITAATQLDSVPVAQEMYWKNKLRDASQSWDPDTFIAAEYSQEVFIEPQLEMLLSGPSYSRRRRSSDGLKLKAANKTEQPKLGYQADSPDSSGPDVLIYGRQLAFVLACIYPNNEPSHDYQKSMLTEDFDPLGASALTSNNRDKGEAPVENLCTASSWSVGFAPNKLIASSADSSEFKQKRTSSETGNVNSNSWPNAKPKIDLAGGTADLFTISLVTVIVGLAMVAVICIAVGCVMRRRRPKSIKGDMSISLVNSDNTLKTPLMNQKAPSFPEENEKVEPSKPDLQAPGTIDPTPHSLPTAISLTHLPEYVATLKQNSGLKMSAEYESIVSDTGLTWKCANTEENRPKNRYANVVAYDHSRVILSEIPNVPGSDYINANYIDGYQRQRAYIATQGPLPETFYDFWRMVWEQNSRILVMMTRLEERARIKCDQYWPNRGTESFTYQHDSKQADRSLPSYTVTIKDTAEYAYYTLRTFLIQKHDLHSQSETSLQHPNLADGESREIKHFQFTAWPDYGTPDHPQPLLLFIRRVTQVRSHMLHQLQQERLVNGDSMTGRGSLGGGPNHVSNSMDLLRSSSPNFTDVLGPTVVHCSAGVGRTGAFIVIDSQLERLKHEKSVDIFGSVGRMRNQRNFMVQTEEQYTFLYDVFLEAATVNGTEVTAHGLYNHVVKLRQTAPQAAVNTYKAVGNGNYDSSGVINHLPTLSSNQSGLELEFKRLDTNLFSKKQITAAVLPENRLKNRVADILPYESNRVSLPLIRGLSGSDYINSSYIDGYRKKRAYIITQAPLPNTIDDFWRMIWEHNSPIIVMLSDQVDSVSVQTTQQQQQQELYWPMERSTRYQHLLVEPMVEYNMPHFILREFRLTDTRDGQSRTLRQFQLHGWPPQLVVPKSAEAMIDLIGQVHKTQTQFGQDGPITVHCSTGSGRSAVFICLSLLLERMRCEGMVDVFLTTRMLRTQRIQMIQTADQYAFCYAATLEYLASFDHYTS
ncbi:unnamed protein product [Calicophoron daubneyi]|uniref:protein-tyrosine-phosphatase n=1 Tax=Calicophoron daubneyi TaxID=300641 RepID=A0AAV2TRC2_CALDB